MSTTSTESTERHSHICTDALKAVNVHKVDPVNKYPGFYKVLSTAEDTQLCFERCCQTRWCDFVVISSRLCYGIPCVQSQLCKDALIRGNHNQTPTLGNTGQEIPDLDKGNIKHYLIALQQGLYCSF